MGSHRYRFLLNGSNLLPLFLWLLDFLPHRRLAVGREVGCGVVPKPVDKVVEGSDTGDIPRLETGEDSEESRAWNSKRIFRKEQRRTCG